MGVNSITESTSNYDVNKDVTQVGQITDKKVTSDIKPNTQALTTAQKAGNVFASIAMVGGFVLAGVFLKAGLALKGLSLIASGEVSLASAIGYFSKKKDVAPSQSTKALEDQNKLEENSDFIMIQEKINALGKESIIEKSEVTGEGVENLNKVKMDEIKSRLEEGWVKNSIEHFNESTTTCNQEDFKHMNKTLMLATLKELKTKNLQGYKIFINRLYKFNSSLLNQLSQTHYPEYKDIFDSMFTLPNMQIGRGNRNFSIKENYLSEK